ncbi:MAG: hypothetical protein IMX00_04690 [Limnochordales bacterium]|nr:hypothetical protein [Limnochordales bacterium]
MIESNGKERAGQVGEYGGSTGREHFGYRIASLSPRQLEIVQATESLLSLTAGKRLVVVVYESTAATGELHNERQDNQGGKDI